MQSRENHNTFDHSLYQEHHHQKDLINPFKNFPIQHTPVNFLLFTDSPQWGTALTSMLRSDAWKTGDLDQVQHSSSRYMGSYKVAHEARQHGFSVQVVDFHSFLDRKTLKQIIKKFVGDETLLIGVSNTFRNFPQLNYKSSICNFDPFEDYTPEEIDEWHELQNHNRFFTLGGPTDRDIKQLVQKINPKTKFIMGGANTNPNQEKAKGEELIDYINLGFGDVTVPELLQQLKEDSIDSTHYPTNKNKIFTLMDAKSRLDIENSTMTWQPEDHVIDGELLPLEVARGCIFKCRFCSFALNGKQKNESLRSIHCIEKELIDNYEKYGVTDYWLTDDTFNDDHDKVIAWYEMSQRLPFKLKWSAFIRWDLVYANRKHDIPQAKLLADSGATLLHLGIESTNPDSAKDVGKGWNPMQQFEFLREMKQTLMKDVHFLSGFIAGLPSDTPKTLKDMSNYLCSKQNPLVSVLMTPLFIRKIGDNTDHFTELSESDFSKNWKEWGYEPTTVDMRGQPIPEEFIKMTENIILWKNKSGLTLYDAWKYVQKYESRMVTLGLQKVGALFYAHGLPYKDSRLHAKQTDYNITNQNIWNFKEYAKINQYFYKLFTFNQPHYK